MAQVEVTTKKWWQSKIVAISGTIILVFGSNFFLHFLTGSVGVKVDQIQSVENSVPAVNEVIDRIRNGENILSVAGTIVGVLIAYFRIFGTTQLIPQSTTKLPKV